MLLNLYLLRLRLGPEGIGLTNAVSALGFALFGMPAAALGEAHGISG